MANADASVDIITSIQHRLDELATQLYAALRYTSAHHPSIASSALAASVISPPAAGNNNGITATGNGAVNSRTNHAKPSSPSGAGDAGDAGPGASQSQEGPNGGGGGSSTQIPGSPSHQPASPAAFDADLSELAVDLVAKQREIEVLIARLPRDLHAARAGQERRITELADQLLGMEDRAGQLQRRRDAALLSVERVIGRYRRA